MCVCEDSNERRTEKIIYYKSYSNMETDRPIFIIYTLMIKNGMKMMDDDAPSFNALPIVRLLVDHKGSGRANAREHLITQGLAAMRSLN